MLAPPRYQHTTTTLHDGSLIVAGGFATGFGDFAPTVNFSASRRESDKGPDFESFTR